MSKGNELRITVGWAAIMVTLLLQLATGIWMASALFTRVDQIQAAMVKAEVKYDVSLREQVDQGRRLAVTEDRLSRVLRVLKLE